MYYALLAIDSDKEHTEKVVNAVTALPREPSDLQVLVLNVFKEFEVTDEGGTVSSEEIYSEEAVPKSVKVAAQELEEYGAHTEMRREHGEPKETILSVAEDEDVDSIFMCGRKRTPAGKAMFGSVTQAVLLNANRPVMVTTI